MDDQDQVPATGHPAVDLGTDVGGASTQPSSLKAPDAQRRRISGRLIVIIVALVLLVGVIIAVVLLVFVPSDTIGLGPGSATITWSAGNNFGSSPRSTQSFSGDIEGHPVSGVATSLISGSTFFNVPSPSAPFRFARWTGTFAGHSFDLVVSIRFGSLFTTTPTVSPGSQSKEHGETTA